MNWSLENLPNEIFENIICQIVDDECDVNIDTLNVLLRVSKTINELTLNYMSEFKTLSFLIPKDIGILSFRNLVKVKGVIKINNYNELKAIFNSKLRYFKIIIKRKCIINFAKNSETYRNKSLLFSYLSAQKRMIGIFHEIRNAIFEYFYVETLIDIIRKGADLNDYKYYLSYYEYQPTSAICSTKGPSILYGVNRGLISLDFDNLRSGRTDYGNLVDDDHMMKLFDFLSEKI